IGRRQLQEPGDRRRPDGDRQRRLDGRAGDQENGGHGARAGRGVLRVLRDAECRDPDRLRRLHLVAQRNPRGADHPGEDRRGRMSTDDPRFEALLDYLKGTRGFDFTAYKRSSLMRRIQKRLQALTIASYDDYQAYLEAHPEEFPLLFNTILIN